MTTVHDGSVSTIPIQLGRDETGRRLVGDLAEASHWVGSGVTRSGKSVLTYSILAQAARNDAVLVVGCDPTTLVLGPHQDRRDHGHFALGLDDMGQHLAVLDWCKEESDRRIAAMRSLKIDKYAEFSPGLPLILLVLEEYPGILEAAEMEDMADGRKPADRIAPRIRARVSALVAQSAKAGVRVLLLMQRAEVAAGLSGSARSNFGTRIQLRADNPDGVRMLHPSATPEECEAVGQFLPGVGLIAAPGLSRRRFRADFVPDYATYYDHVTGV